MSALGAQGNCATCGSRALNYFWLIPAQAGINRGFRPLRRATQGAALRTRSLSRKAGESFHFACVREFIFSTTVDSHVDNLKSLVKYDTMYSE